MPTDIAGRPDWLVLRGSFTKLVTAIWAACHQVIGGLEPGSGSPIDNDWSNMRYTSTGAGSTLNDAPPHEAESPPVPVPPLSPPVPKISAPPALTVPPKLDVPPAPRPA